MLLCWDLWDKQQPVEGEEALYVDDRCDYKLGGVGWVGTQVTQCPQADQLTSLPCPTTSEQEPSSVFLSWAPRRPWMRRVPSSVTPTPYVRRSLRYLLSQKRRVRASRTSSTAALRTSAGGSAQPPRRPWTKLWKTWVPSSSLSVRLCRFSVCSPELCARDELVTPLAVASPSDTPRWVEAAASVATIHSPGPGAVPLLPG